MDLQPSGSSTPDAARELSTEQGAHIYAAALSSGVGRRHSSRPTPSSVLRALAGFLRAR